MATFYDIPKSLMPSYQRYMVLFAQQTLSQAEQAEFENLDALLTPYMPSASDFNAKMDSPTMGTSGQVLMLNGTTPTWSSTLVTYQVMQRRKNDMRGV